ncbi:LysR family transcriptional regulator [Desulfonema ishimotonii]|uniref:LysR family transcriptional regulator n=1 Tax=Desulfonema ishimotonii TaxID=45657 RepID=A0A401FV83_9BACT|nr:LysR family transcriptional regulator [Desulfonema ishimotonii]GBC60854.1 LysR family transcriptional regulator [Desulfonema ishimotonii]
MKPDFNRLKVFYHIFSRMSIALAAKDLHVTQSAVSQHLQKLEAEIGTPLFTRLHKRLVPTAAGENLFRIVEPFVSELESGLRTIRQAREKPSGRLRIGSPVEFGKKYFPGIFGAFREKYPDVTFFLKLGHSPTLLSMVSQGKLDFAFADIFPTHDRFSGDLGIFSIEPIVEEEIVLACSGEYHARHVEHDHSFEHLVTRDFIAYGLSALPLKNWFRHHFGKAFSRLNIVMAVESHQTVVAGIKHHMGLGVVASHVVHGEISRGEIVPVTTSEKEVINRISLVQLQDKIPTLTEKAFLAHFREIMNATGMKRLE